MYFLSEKNNIINPFQYTLLIYIYNSAIIHKTISDDKKILFIYQLVMKLKIKIYSTPHCWKKKIILI